MDEANDMDKNPTKPANVFKAPPTYPMLKETGKEHKFNAEIVESNIAWIKTQIMSRKLLIKPFFQDWDKLRKERITQNQFVMVLDKLKLLDGVNRTEICKAYMDTRGDIDYGSFVKDCEAGLPPSNILAILNKH